MTFITVLLCALLADERTSFSAASIRFLGLTDFSRAEPIAAFQLSNESDATLRLDPHFTIYWKDSAGEATNSFFQHNLGFAILPPRDVRRVTVPSPSGANVWQISFSYSVRPSLLRRAYHQLQILLPGGWTPDNSFHGQFGPVITNSTATAAYGIFVNTNTR